jgi:acyl-CoA thioester hydrolase
MDSPRTLVHANDIRIRWGDMDAMGHVNNTVYFRYMEQVRIEWFETLGYPVDSRADSTIVIVNASCSFLVPLTYPGIVQVRMLVGDAGRSSLPTYYEMRLAGQDVLSAEGAAKVVWIANATGSSVHLPEKVRQAIQRAKERVA